MTWYWIFGGTAVGKKTYIRLVESETRRAAWMGEGGRTVESLLRHAAGCDLLIRWQWTRDRVLAEAARTHPDIIQRICLLSASPDVQADRALRREGWARWTAVDLEREAAVVLKTAMKLAARHRVSMVIVDVSSPNTADWRWIDDLSR
jgi:hypothetical protein